LELGYGYMAKGQREENHEYNREKEWKETQKVGGEESFES
jgi:hypothetical protein